MKKQLKRLMRHKGYTVKVENVANKQFKWKDTEIINTINNKGVASSVFREILGKNCKITAEDKKEKIIYIIV